LLDRQHMRLQVFGGPSASPAELLYDTQVGGERSDALRDGFTLETPITYAGRRWTLIFTQTKAVANSLAFGRVWVVAATGTALSLLLAGLLYLLRSTRHNARRLAAQFTEDLQHTTERLALAAKAGGVGIWDYDVVQDTLIWDDEMFHLYGITRDRFSGAYEAWAAGVHPEDRRRGNEEIQQAIRGEKEFDTEFRVLWPDGTIRHIRALARVQRNAAGQAVRMLGTNWDITERKQAEEALRAKTTLLSSLVSSLPDILFFKDAQGRYLGCNPEFARFVNRSVPSIVGSTDYDLFDAATAAAFRTQDSLMLDQGKPRHNDEWLTYPDGTRVLADTLKAPLRDGAGRVIGLLGLSRDITERKLAEEKLHQLSRAVEQSPVSIMITDPSGAIQYVNPRFITVTGYTSAEVQGRNARLLKSGTVSPQAYQEMWQTITAGRDWHGEFHNRKKNGDLFWESASISPVLDPEGRLTHFVAVKEDITARKQAEEELLHTLATERELSALKSKFVSLVSHEFRTPLSAILGASEILEDFYDRLAPEKRASYFQMIRQEIQRMTGMLQDVLLQGQLDAGRVQFNPQSTDVVELCESIAHRVQAAFPKHPSVVWEADAPGTRTSADQSLLERVLSNLLTNAFKYSPERTPVRLSVRRVGQEWEIQVQDQGIGIPEQDQADVFSAFRRGGNVGSIKGTGVGLYIVKKCALLQGGRITLSSQAGKGSTFTFNLPWLPVDLSQPENP
jgi:PAS domain S-box-containing protein